MKPIINPWIFYVASVIDEMNVMCGLAIAALIFIASVTVLFGEDVFGIQNIAKKIKKMIIAIIVLTIVIIILPSEQTIYKMLIANMVTTNNIEYAKQEIKDVVDYIDEVLNDDRDN